MRQVCGTVALSVGLAICLMLPAAAATSVGAHSGVLQGIVDVGKQGFCNSDGTGAVSGGGLGVLIGLGTAKNAWFTLANAIVLDTPNLVGVMHLCGRLTAPAQGTVGLDKKSLGIGATCLAHKGWGGYGSMHFTSKPGTVKWISNLGWKSSVGGTMLMTGDAGAEKAKKADLFVAAVQWLSEGVLIGCMNKDLGDKSDPGPFVATGSYEIVPGAGGSLPKKAPKK